MHPIVTLIRDSRAGDSRAAKVVDLIGTLDDDLLALLMFSRSEPADRPSPNAD